MEVLKKHSRSDPKYRNLKVTYSIILHLKRKKSPQFGGCTHRFWVSCIDLTQNFQHFCLINISIFHVDIDSLFLSAHGI